MRIGVFPGGCWCHYGGCIKQTPLRCMHEAHGITQLAAAHRLTPHRSAAGTRLTILRHKLRRPLRFSVFLLSVAEYTESALSSTERTQKKKLRVHSPTDSVRSLVLESSSFSFPLLTRLCPQASRSGWRLLLAASATVYVSCFIIKKTRVD